jgi:hypothetical protein
MSRVDVIIPCYNYGHYLRGCVASVLGQTGVDVRVLVIDDASPDDTPTVAAHLVAQDSRVEYRRHQTNQGHINTYNEGLEWANEEYVVLLSADDWVAPGALSRAARLMETHPEVVLTCGGAVVVRPEGNRIVGVEPEKEEWEILSGEQFLKMACQEANNPVWTPTAVARTAVQKQLGGYRHDLPHTGDLEMWLRFSAHGSVGVINTCQAYYRMHANNMSAEYYARAVLDLRQRLETFLMAFRARKEPVADLRRLEQHVRQTLAEQAYWKAQHAFDRGEVEMCRELLTFAAGSYEDITRWPTWSRMKWKLMVGPRVWAPIESARQFVLGTVGRAKPAERIRTCV